MWLISEYEADIFKRVKPATDYRYSEKPYHAGWPIGTRVANKHFTFFFMVF
jgi:hypothetical protein